ncbi:MAG TPA: cell division topological specificity factor MinE [Verrucomicrobiae bacterium]|nr:cell division topological specificity factor MinE [Verrucomicrobiae bacterium]
MFEFINRMFGKEDSSKSVAKERLRLVLVHDRANVSPHMLNALKEDLIKVISEYMEIDQEALEVNLSTEDSSVALIANIPVVKMKRNYAS